MKRRTLLVTCKPQILVDSFTIIGGGLCCGARCSELPYLGLYSPGIVTLVAVRSMAGQTARFLKTPPPGWSEAVQTMMDLTLDGKHQEVIALAGKWAAKYPTFVDAHLMLGGGYESLGRDLLRVKKDATSAERVKLYETAASHYRRAFELGGERPELTIRTLIDIYGSIALNRPAEKEKVVREAVVRYPASPLAHSELITLLLVKGEQPAAVEKAVAAARARLPKTVDARLDVGRQLAHLASGRERTVTLSRDASAAMSLVALGFVNDALALDPRHVGALETKAAIERMRKLP